ncbi:hypothetical protein BO71DRAFT_20739 [Aspergillus ellipticus CBS 707.79]|uniref:Uncharacterized protein n=1 Tax=Aspergillus ellipticus CBS 707.79 TaxID=1448320 RepID=A0A319D5I4_9EURO|nr:hypothetical protein BO71DRAFT_20739 [Aspergillus ellipticus CBS 707.79]
MFIFGCLGGMGWLGGVNVSFGELILAFSIRVQTWGIFGMLLFLWLWGVEGLGGFVMGSWEKYVEADGFF